MKIVVTGGFGFIGSCLINKLIKNKKNIVLNLDALKYSSMPESLEEVKINKNYSFKKIDLYDFNKLKRIIKKFRPDIIFHLAAESHVDNSILNSYDFIKSNIIGTYNILKSIQLYSRQTLLLHVSTDEVYGSLKNNKENSFTEESKFYPSSPYSATKASSDLLVNAWNQTYNLRVIVTNCVNNFGKWQFPEKLIPVVIDSCLKFKKIPVYGNGKNIREWIDVENHVEYLIHLSKFGKIGETYNIGSGYEIENILLIKKICKYFDNKLPKKQSYQSLINFVKDRPGHDLRYSVNTSKINKIFKKNYNEEFDDKFHDTIDWYINNRTWLQNKIKSKKIK